MGGENAVLDKVLSEINGAKTELFAQIDEGLKSKDEQLAEFTKRFESIESQLSDFRKNFVAPGSPVSQLTGEAASQRGGLFEGQFKLPYAKAIELSHQDPILRSSDAERLQTTKMLHDAVALRVWREMATNRNLTQSEAIDNVRKTSDFHNYVQALDSTGYLHAGEITNPEDVPGSYFDFTILTSNLIDLVRQSLVVANQFPMVPLPRAKTDYPALRGDVKGILGGGVAWPARDNADLVAVPNTNARLQPTFGDVSFVASHCLGFLLYSDDWFEDSVIPVMNLMMEQARIMIARAWDDAVLNGDNTATHMDVDVTAAYDFNKAWDGLRKLSENNWVDHAGAVMNLAAVRALRKSMGKYAQKPQDLVYFFGLQEWFYLLQNEASLQTVNTIGIDRATLRTGVIDSLEGSDVVVSEFVRADLPDDGMYDGVTTTKTCLTAAARSRFWHGMKGGTKVETVRVPASGATWIQANARSDFQAIDKDSADNVFAVSSHTPVNTVIDILAA